MIQKTFNRIRRGWPVKNIYVSTSGQQYDMLRKQLPAIARNKYILEPARRDTAAAIGLATTYLWKKDPRAVMCTVASDHYFREVKEYVRILKTAGKVVSKYPERTVLIGVKPTFAHTGLGYIKMRKQITSIGRDDIFSVDRFIEKPNEAKAKKLVVEWQYLWNIGSFVFRVDAMLEKYKRHLPHSYKILMTIAKDIGTSREQTTIKRLFPKMDKISIDYGIMEHDKSMLVVPADVTWADIGSWREVYEMLRIAPKANVVKGRHIAKDSAGNLIYTDEKKVVATAGVHDLVIVDTPDALLICPRDRAQDVKHLVAAIEEAGMEQYL